MALSAPITPEQTSFTGNPIHLRITTDDPAVEFISLTLNISDIAGTKTITSEFFLEPDSGLMAETDLAPLIHGFLDDESWPVPSYPQTLIKLANEKICKFWLTAEEVIGGVGNGEEFQILEANARIGIWGGLDYQVHPGATFFSTMMTNAAPNYPFLNHRPFHQLSHKDHSEFLFYYMIATGTNVKLFVNMKFKDLSTNIIELFNPTAMNQFSMYRIPVGYGDLGLSTYDVDPANPIIQYTVWLAKVADDSDLSEQYIFNVNQKYLGDLRHFIFYGSLGGMETAIMFGDYESSNKIKGQTLTKYTGPAYQETFPQKFSRNRMEQFNMKATSGLVPEGSIQWLRDFLTSPMVYEVVTRKSDPADKLLIPVIISEGKFKLIDESDQIFQLEFSYEYAYETKHPRIKMIDGEWFR